MPYKKFVTFKSAYETLMCNHSNESFHLEKFILPYKETL